jgi:hypothetical protein
LFVNHLFGKRGLFCRYHLPNQRVTKVPVPFTPALFSSVRRGHFADRVRPLFTSRGSFRVRERIGILNAYAIPLTTIKARIER